MRNTTEKPGTRLAIAVRTMVFVTLFDLLTFSYLYVLARRTSATDSLRARQKIAQGLLAAHREAHPTHAARVEIYGKLGREDVNK
jgi:hypothetical protein